MNTRFNEHRLTKSRSFLCSPQVWKRLVFFNLSDLKSGTDKYRKLCTRITKVQAALSERAIASESCQITSDRTQNKMIPFREHGTHKASIAAMIFFAIVALLIFGMLRFCSARNQETWAQLVLRLGPIYVPIPTPYRSVKVGSAASASDNSSSALYAAATLHERSEADRFPNVVSEAADGGESDVSGDTSESLGSTDAEYSDDDDHDNIWPPLNYEKFVRDGAQVIAYLMASDRDLTAKFESDRVLRPGESLASQFRDQRSLRENGWNNRDATVRLRQDFPSALPIRSALRGLGVSPHARPVGLIEYWKYEHTARWNHRGRQVQVTKRVVPPHDVID